MIKLLVIVCTAFTATDNSCNELEIGKYNSMLICYNAAVSTMLLLPPVDGHSISGEEPVSISISVDCSSAEDV